MSAENGQKEKKPFKIKEFFKSTSFKCIAVLLAIVLVCGILLTICNSLFKVTDQERLDRVLSQIYGESVETKEHELTEYETTEFKGSGSINNVYEVTSDGNYLINATGTGGFQGGTVTCWVVIEMTDGSVSGIGNVVVSENTNQSWIANVPDSAFEHFGDSYTDGETFDVSDWQDNGLTGGATGSTTAIVNAVNTALLFARSQIAGEVIEPDVNPFEDFDYTKYIDTTATKVTLNEDGSSVDFEVVTTTGYGPVNAFTIDITVNAQGVITAYSIKVNGSTDDYYKGLMDEDIANGNAFLQKDSTAILQMFKEPSGEDGEFVKEDLTDNSLASSASNSTMDNAGYSNFLCIYAALFAAANYENGFVMALENSVEYTKYIDTTATKVALNEDGSSVDFEVVTTTGYGPVNAFTIDITVNAQGVITAYSIKVNGSTDDYYKGLMDEDIANGNAFLQKDSTAILQMFKEPSGEDGEFVKEDLTDNSLASSASNSTMDNAGYSNFLCIYAALFAAANYEVYAELAAIEQEQLNAQMSEIYGETIAVEAVSIDGLTTTVGNGTVNTVYRVTGTDNYIINATGTGGFSSGTVTCWIVVETANSAVSGIGNVVYDTNTNQTWLENITDEAYSHFGDIFNGNDFVVSDWTDNELHGGASMSMTAIVNSVNSAKNFVATLITAGGAEV